MWKPILETFLFMVIVLLVGILKQKNELSIDIVKLIAEAETKPLSGEEKMQWLVNEVYNKLIPFAKAYFTRERIQTFAQVIFDGVKQYTLAHIKKVKK